MPGCRWICRRIGRWPISERLQAIPQYYLTGYSGAPLGHGVELLVALLLAWLAITIDVDLSPRLQRGNWREVARALGSGGQERAITLPFKGGCVGSVD